jgi:isoquinoline 1-oxidoreductase beta subunit
LPKPTAIEAACLGAGYTQRHEIAGDGDACGGNLRAEVSVDRNTGKIKVHNYWVAVDPGLVIQPDHVHGQLESAVVFGLSAALLEELTVKAGAIQQSNFNDYPVLRMSDVPDIHTKIVATENPPTGMGEIGVVAVAPAIANALFQLTGKRIRNLPMSPDRVKRALA